MCQNNNKGIEKNVISLVEKMVVGIEILMLIGFSAYIILFMLLCAI